MRAHGYSVGHLHSQAQVNRKKDTNCSDFSSQAAAQAYFLAHGGPGSDPDGLDADGDGIACEDNPGPYNYSTSTSGGGSGGGSQGGSGGHHADSSSCAGIPASRGSKPMHKISVKTKRISGGKFAVYGTASSLPSGQLQLFKARGKNGHYCYDSKGRSRSDGHYRIAFYGPVGTCYKLVSPATGKRRETISNVGCIDKR